VVGRPDEHADRGDADCGTDPDDGGAAALPDTHTRTDADGDAGTHTRADANARADSDARTDANATDEAVRRAGRSSGGGRDPRRSARRRPESAQMGGTG